jgi:hypothetical protein
MYISTNKLIATLILKNFVLYPLFSLFVYIMFAPLLAGAFEPITSFFYSIFGNSIGALVAFGYFIWSFILFSAFDSLCFNNVDYALLLSKITYDDKEKKYYSLKKLCKQIVSNCFVVTFIYFILFALLTGLDLFAKNYSTIFTLNSFIHLSVLILCIILIWLDLRIRYTTNGEKSLLNKIFKLRYKKIPTS